MDSLFPELSREKQVKLAAEMYSLENAYVKTAPCKVYDGVLELVPELSKKYKLFIVSNCQKGYIEAFLENTRLGEYIIDYECSGNTGFEKGANIKLIMERNQIEDAVYIGDTQRDADAAKEAGIPVIYAAYGFGKMRRPEEEIHSFRELGKLLE